MIQSRHCHRTFALHWKHCLRTKRILSRYFRSNEDAAETQHQPLTHGFSGLLHQCQSSDPTQKADKCIDYLGVISSSHAPQSDGLFCAQEPDIDDDMIGIGNDK